LNTAPVMCSVKLWCAQSSWCGLSFIHRFT